MKKNLPRISTTLYKSKKLANGEHPIMLRVCYNGQRKYKGMGISSHLKDWNEKKGEVRSTHPKAKDINTIILKEKGKAEDVVLTLEKAGVAYSVTSIISAITKENPSKVTLFSLFEERIEFFKRVAQQFNTATGYRTLLNIIKRYTNNKDVELLDLDLAWIRDFEAHLRTKYQDTSISKFFDCLKAIMNYAVVKNYISESPLNKYKFLRKLDTRTKKRALSIPEITSLMKYYYNTYGIVGTESPDIEVCKKHYWNKSFKRRGENKLTPIDAEQFSLALYLCSYCMQGLALIDLANLRWKDFQEVEIVNKDKYARDVAIHGIEYAEYFKETEEYYKIEVERAKTGHPVRIIVNSQVLMPYINPFTDNCDKKDEYVFPIYSNIDDTPEKKFGRMTYATYLVNYNLKRIGQRLGIEGLTFYSARHSYASNLYHNNVAMGLIAQNMGRNISDIETYLKGFADESIIKANQSAFVSGQSAFVKAKESVHGTNDKDTISKEKEEFAKYEQYGGVKGYVEFIDREREKLRIELQEKFGDDREAKIQYLMNKGEEGVI